MDRLPDTILIRTRDGKLHTAYRALVNELSTSFMTSKTLKQMLRIQTQIEHLQTRMNGLAGNGTANGHVKRQMSPSARKNIVNAQRKRWAAWRKENK